MIVVRPANPDDLDQLLRLTALTGFGLSTLPPDREFLAERLQVAHESFAGLEDKEHGNDYLFVMTDDEEVIGTCGIVPRVGVPEPFYAYRVETLTLQSEALDVYKQIDVLNLMEERHGPSEVGSLFLRPDHARKGLGRWLSRSRFLFIAEHRDLFQPTVIAEMRGRVDDQGCSPFWESLGRQFFDIDFPKADYMSMKNKTFISDLMPRHPIYIPLLSKEAQAVVGQVHEKTAPALRLLQAEGFEYAGMVDIFEGGPVVSCKRDEIRTVEESRRARVAKIALQEMDGESCLVSRIHPEFCTGRGVVERVTDDEIVIGPDTASCLGIREGDVVRYAPASVASSPPKP